MRTEHHCSGLGDKAFVVISNQKWTHKVDGATVESYYEPSEIHLVHFQWADDAHHGDPGYVGTDIEGNSCPKCGQVLILSEFFRAAGVIIGTQGSSNTPWGCPL